MHHDATWYGGRPQPCPRDFMLDGDPAPSPIFGPCLLWPNGCMDQDGTSHGGGSWSRPHFARGAVPPHSRPILLWPNGWMHQDATCYEGRPQPRRHCVRWGPSPLPTKERSPQFSAHVYYGQTAPWIKMSLGTEVGLGLRDIALDEDPAPPPLKGHSPQFSANVRCGHTAGWTKMPLGM